MIDIMSLRQSYERREITEVRWIRGENNPADSMTKAKASLALKTLVDTNKINLTASEWIERDARPETERKESIWDLMKDQNGDVEKVIICWFFAISMISRDQIARPKPE